MSDVKFSITTITPKWRWSVFGKGPGEFHLFLIETPLDQPLWRRIITRILLGSSWERIDKK